MASTTTTDPIGLSESTLRGLSNSKWSKYGPDVLPAWVAEMDFGVAPPVQEAVRRLVDNADYGYPMRNGGKAGLLLASAFAERMKDRFGWAADPNLVIPCADLVQGTFAPVLAFSDPGDGVVLQMPSYPPFQEVLRTTGRKMIPLQMVDDGKRFSCDVASIEKAVDRRTRIFVLCNPQNPTGRVFSREELLTFAEFATRHDMTVISDEIHSDIVYAPNRHIPFASLSPEIAARTITITSATKSFNIPGLRAALMHFGDKALLGRYLAKFPARMMGDANAIGVDATVAAWRHGQPWLDSIVSHLDKTRLRLVDRLKEAAPAIKCHAPEGTFLAWLDCSALGLNAPAAEFFLDHAKVAFSPGEAFDPAGAQHVRFNFATSTALLDRIVDQVGDSLRRR